MKNLTLWYENDNWAHSFICVSDFSFADNMLNWKNSQEYIMLLFEDSITWKTNKQNTVTISSTEAELLTLSQIIKKAIFISRLLKSLMLKLNESLIVECDNTQTLWLVIEKFMKLSIKLHHVDIHNHWLWQEHAERRVLFERTSMKKMIADRLTKTLLCQQHTEFLRQINLDNVLIRIQHEKWMEALRDKIKKARNPANNLEKTVFLLTKESKMRIW